MVSVLKHALRITYLGSRDQQQQMQITASIWRSRVICLIHKQAQAASCSGRSLFFGGDEIMLAYPCEHHRKTNFAIPPCSWLPWITFPSKAQQSHASMFSLQQKRPCQTRGIAFFTDWWNSFKCSSLHSIRVRHFILRVVQRRKISLHILRARWVVQSSSQGILMYLCEVCSAIALQKLMCSYVNN